MTRHNFTVRQQKDMDTRSGGICEAGKGGTEAFYGMASGETCQRKATAFDHVTADALKRTKPQSIDEGLHVCGLHHQIKTQGHDMPKIRKAQRIEQKAKGIKSRSHRPMQGSKLSRFKKSFSGKVTKR